MKNIELKYLKILYTMLIIQYSYMIIMRLFNIDINNTYTKFILMIPLLSITIFTIYFKIKPFNKKYQKIVEYFFNNSDFDDDTTGTNLMMALDEVTRLRTIIINKYHSFLKRQKEEELLKKLKFLENELRVKIIDYKLIREQELNKEKNKSR